MPTYKLGDIDARVLDRLDGNSLLYPLTQRTDEINDSLRVMNLFTGFSMATVPVAGGVSIAGQLIYRRPAGLIFPLHVYFNGRQLDKLSVRAISTRYQSWATDQSNRGMPVQEWVPMGFGMFAIHPIDPVGGNVITVNGFAEPVPLVLTTDTVTVPDEQMALVEELTAHVLQIKESGAIFNQASVIYQKFMREMKQYMYWKQLVMPRYFVRMRQPEQARELGEDVSQ